MVKYLTQHTDYKNFFYELEENEIFMYSYLDYTWEDVVKLAEENEVRIEYITKGTEEYKKYGECTAKVIQMKGKIYKYKLSSGETINIEARDEKSACEKLMEHLFKSNYINLHEVK